MKYFLSLLLLLWGAGNLSGQTVNGTVTFVATVTDATVAVGDTECGIASVQFFNGATAISPLLTAPTSGNDYVFKLDTKTLTNGTYAFTAKAIDKAGSSTDPAKVCDGTAGNIGVSNVLNVVINNATSDTHAPTITITITVTVAP